MFGLTLGFLRFLRRLCGVGLFEGGGAGVLLGHSVRGEDLNIKVWVGLGFGFFGGVFAGFVGIGGCAWFQRFLAHYFEKVKRLLT